DPIALEALGLIHLQTGAFAEAASILRRAALAAPESARAHAMLAAILRDAGQPHAEPLARALELDPDETMALLIRAWQRGHSGDLPGARRDFARIELLDGPGPALAYQLGTTLLDAGLLDEALRHLDAAVVEELTATAEAHVNRGICLYRLGRLPEALAALIVGLEEKPSLLNGLAFRGLVHAALGKKFEARADLQRFLEHVTQGPMADEARRALAKLR
ncbi:MAG: tetratricopeptide repeat protein, partial [Planctomycetota bacterium]